MEKNAYKLNRERKNFKNDVDKQKAVKNFILFSNEIESNNNQKEINKNYFNFTRPNKIFFNPNDYINASNKINNNLQKNQNSKNFSRNFYNKSFEINKNNFKKESTESYNKNILIDNRKYQKDNKIYNIFASFKIINNPKIEKEKEKEKSPIKEKKLKYFSSFYFYRYKKKEIIKIQSIWRGYYFRKKNIGKIKSCLLSICLVNIFIKIYKNRKINLYNEFLKILKNNKNNKYRFGSIKNINFKQKYTGYAKRNLISKNDTTNINKNINEKSPKTKEDNKIKMAFSKISEIKAKKINENDNQNKIKEKNKNINDIDDIFNSPLKIIYVPKKIVNKNRYYYMKRITNIKKLKLEEFMKFIKKKFLSLYFTILKNQYKYNSNLFKIKKLISIIDSIIKNYIRKNLNIYREKIIDKKVKEEIMKKNNLSPLSGYKKNHINIFKQRKFLKNNIIEKNLNIKPKGNLDSSPKIKFLEKNLANDISFIVIIENICESENEEESQKINYENKKDNLSLLNKIVSKKMKYNFSILNKYYRQWKQFSDSFNDNGRPILKLRNMHSPDLEIKGNKSKKRYIKIKYSKALTSKTNISSIISEGRSNSSSSRFYVKKMKVRNLVVNANANNQIIKYKEESTYTRNIKLSYILQKIDNKTNIIKCFKSWKKQKS